MTHALLVIIGVADGPGVGLTITNVITAVPVETTMGLSVSAA
jgi:hypothetical protein